MERSLSPPERINRAISEDRKNKSEIRAVLLLRTQGRLLRSGGQMCARALDRTLGGRLFARALSSHLHPQANCVALNKHTLRLLTKKNCSP